VGPHASVIYSKFMTSTYRISRKVVCLFLSFVCHIEISQTMVPLPTLLVLLESPWWVTRALSWFYNVLTFSGEVIEYWTTFSLKI
jgi:hypothetical protein